MKTTDNIRDLQQLVSTLIEEITSLKSQLASLETENAALRIENATLKQEISLLKIENVELKARLNQNSSNSSKPPSSDYYNRKPAFPKVSKGKKGGQPGHKGNTLKQIDNPDKIVEPRRAHASNVVRKNVIVDINSVMKKFLLQKNVSYSTYHNQS